jgi:hypothetical protein
MTPNNNSSAGVRAKERTMLKRLAIATFVALLFSLVPDAAAAIARAVPFEEKVELADAIVRGRVVRSHSAFDESGRWIVTHTTFRVEKTYKGSAPVEVTVVTPGGSVGSLHQETVGVPSFGAGEERVLFVRSSRIGATVLFQEQGAYRVLRNGSEAMVAPATSELVLVDPQSGRASAREPVRSLGAFENEVNRSLARGERKSR